MALHVALAVVVFWGHEQVLTGSASGLWMSLALAAAGLFALLVHGWFLLKGRPEFRSIASVAVLVSTGAVSIAQAAVVTSCWRQRIIRAPIQ